MRPEPLQLLALDLLPGRQREPEPLLLPLLEVRLQPQDAVGQLLRAQLSLTSARPIEEREAENREQQAGLDRLDEVSRRAAAFDPERFQDAVADLVDSLVTDLGETPKTQQTLSRLLTRPIEVYPNAEGWRFKLWASFAKLGGGRAEIAIERAVGDVMVPPG